MYSFAFLEIFLKYLKTSKTEFEFISRLRILRTTGDFIRCQVDLCTYTRACNMQLVSSVVSLHLCPISDWRILINMCTFTNVVVVYKCNRESKGRQASCTYTICRYIPTLLTSQFNRGGFQ